MQAWENRGTSGLSLRETGDWIPASAGMTVALGYGFRFRMRFGGHGRGVADGSTSSPPAD